MTIRIRIFNKCMHKGMGVFCHRCQQADQILTASDNLNKLDNKQEIMVAGGRRFNVKGKCLREVKTMLLAEAKRLHDEGKRSS